MGRKAKGKVTKREPAVEADDTEARAEKRKAEYAREGKEMGDAAKPKTEAELVRAIKVELNGVRDGLRTSVEHAIQAGEYLIEAKAFVGHGRFCKWCEKHFKVSSRQLQKYQRLALYIREAKAKSTSLSEPDWEVIYEKGFEDALHWFQVREEDLPPAPRWSSDGDEDKSSDDSEDKSSGDSEDKSSGDAAEDDDAQARRENTRKKWVAGLYTRADNSLRDAQINGDWSRYRDLIDDAAFEQAKRAAEAWSDLVKYLEQLREPPLQQAAE
jgi:hypothetical protein